MRTDPRLLEGRNKLWIRFFLIAVFATMHVRDHARPAFHKALGVDVDWYDAEVFRITSEITRQVFPIELDLDNPRWNAGLAKMRRIAEDMDAAKRQGGVTGKLRTWVCGARAAATFAGLYFIPVKQNALPESSRLQPAY
jgi:magnesium-protoporphyrin IX monomethyl ester (oxidative) cyclase